MLVLSRLPGENIVCTLENGKRITIVITRLDRGRIYVGIDAPREIEVNRGEVQKSIDEENEFLDKAESLVS